jgi:hypothetical protein
MAQERRADRERETTSLMEAPPDDLDLYMREPPEIQLLGQIREGMRVVDANGEEVGKIEIIQMGDPDAVTVSPIVLQDRLGLREAFLRGTEPHVPEPFFSHLLRVGFVKIDGRGWIDTDYYVTPDMIQEVAGDTVKLNTAKDRIITEI